MNAPSAIISREQLKALEAAWIRTQQFAGHEAITASTELHQAMQRYASQIGALTAQVAAGDDDKSSDVVTLDIPATAEALQKGEFSAMARTIQTNAQEQMNIAGGRALATAGLSSGRLSISPADISHAAWGSLVGAAGALINASEALESSLCTAPASAAHEPLHCGTAMTPVERDAPER